MTTEYHAFVDGDAGLCGAVLRRIEPRSMRTRTVFRMGADAPVYLVDHRVDHDGDVRRWTRFRYVSPTSQTEHAGTRDSTGAVHVDGVEAPELADALGGYGEHLVLTQMLAADAEVESYVSFDEGDPRRGPERAELQRLGTESIELLDGTVVDAERVRLVVAGRPTNTHWCVAGTVVKSDWCGAQSFLVDDLDGLCAELDPEVAARIHEFAVHSFDEPVR